VFFTLADDTPSACSGVHSFNDRNRGSYSQAALCLREIHDIYRQLNETESWQKLIMDVRDRHKRLPALQDELNQLKL
jgi:uncharacterized Zn finger protein